MRKALLVTIQNDFNFGNRLQNYALQKVLEDLGYVVDNLILWDMNTTSIQKIKNTVRKALACLGIRRFVWGASIWKRKDKCNAFSQEYIHNYIYLTRDQVDSYDFRQYDVAVSGSDQVWHNWNRMRDELSYYYLDFVDKARRIAYAPSFGFKAFPEADAEKHREGLMGMKALSCREQEGCNLIYALTGRKAQKVLDPTLLLSAADWEKIERKPEFRVPEKYLLQIMLGEVTPECQHEAERLAGSQKAKVININDINDPKHYGISPAEFIWLVHHAQTVCTDSFHASVFSILFERDLRVFERVSPKLGNMFGRLHDLLQPLGLDHVVYGAGEDSLSTKLNSQAREYMEEARCQSIAYLRDSLGS